jgi:hypothetical protein
VELGISKPKNFGFHIFGDVLFTLHYHSIIQSDAAALPFLLLLLLGVG